MFGVFLHPTLTFWDLSLLSNNNASICFESPQAKFICTLLDRECDRTFKVSLTYTSSTCLWTLTPYWPVSYRWKYKFILVWWMLVWTSVGWPTLWSLVDGFGSWLFGGFLAPVLKKSMSLLTLTVDPVVRSLWLVDPRSIRYGSRCNLVPRVIES